MFARSIGIAAQKPKGPLVPDTAQASQLDAREEDVERTVSPELADELNYAPLANLKGHAVSEQATALVQHLAHKYPRAAQASTRTKLANKPRKLEPDFHRAIAAFLAELLAARAEEGAAGWLRLSLDKDKFKGALVSYRMFNGVRKTWRSAGLIEEQKGCVGVWLQLGADLGQGGRQIPVLERGAVAQGAGLLH
jgi:hypothetical protein